MQNKKLQAFVNIYKVKPTSFKNHRVDWKVMPSQELVNVRFYIYLLFYIDLRTTKQVRGRYVSGIYIKTYFGVHGR